MSNKGFKIDSNMDIQTNNGLFLFVNDLKEIEQRIKNEFLTLIGEIEDEPERGFNLFGIILNETSSKTQRKNEVKRVLSYIKEIEVLEVIEEKVANVYKYYISIKYNNTITTVEIGL